METIKNFLSRFSFGELEINLGFLKTSVNFSKADRNAAWEMYVELITRVTTQGLAPTHGNEETALQSVYVLFELTRETAKKYGPEAITFTRLAVIILNQVIRPFTASWHKKSMDGAFKSPLECAKFRTELAELQVKLRNYTRLLAEMAQVEDITIVEE